MRVAGGSLHQSVNKWGAIWLTGLASDQRRMQPEVVLLHSSKRTGESVESAGMPGRQ
jgi:hypothetical protein